MTSCAFALRTPRVRTNRQLWRSKTPPSRSKKTSSGFGSKLHISCGAWCGGSSAFSQKLEKGKSLWRNSSASWAGKPIRNWMSRRGRRPPRAYSWRKSVTNGYNAAAMTNAHLRKAMGFSDLVLFYVVTALSLRWIATAAAAGPGAIVILEGGCLAYFVPLTFCVLELSSRYPEEGGMYVWSKKAFGEFAGFMTGWMYWTANLPYYPGVLYFAAGNALYVAGDRWQHLSNNRSYFI